MPGPPPGAAAPVGSSDFAVFVVVVVDVAAAGELAAAGEAAFGWNQERLAGLGEAAAGEAAVAAAAAGEDSFLERLCLAVVGEASALAAGDSAVAAVATGEASFLARLCLAVVGELSGLAAGDDDWATNEAIESPVTTIIRPINLFIATTIPAAAMTLQY